jgi:hypothetical protein
MIEVRISVDGHNDGSSFIQITRQDTDPARAVALALAAVAEYVPSPKVSEIAESANRIAGLESTS